MTEGDLNPLSEAAEKLARSSESDVFLYNGPIARGADFEFIECIHENKNFENAILILVTSGGSPDAAYKIARYFQNSYKKFTVLVTGFCKSAGTLIAVGAQEIAFAPYGELGPVDIQTYKTDNLAERQSGLTITESIETLMGSALRAHGRVFGAIMSDTDAIVAFKTAADAASQLVTGLYGEIFSQIDPTEVGEKARAMRIADDYGSRLNARSKNLKENALKNLTQTYSSHSFVIDFDEAVELFHNVRHLTVDERALVDVLQHAARHELPERRDGPTFFCLSGGITEEASDEAADKPGSSRGNGADSAETVGASADRSGDAPPSTDRHARSSGRQKTAKNSRISN